METPLKEFEKSVERLDFNSACSILKKFGANELESVPIKSLKIMIDEGSKDAFVLAMRTLGSLAPKRKDAMDTLIEYVGMKDKKHDATRALAVFVLAELPAKELSLIPNDVFYGLLRDIVTDIKYSVLNILEKIARAYPRRIPVESLCMALLREKNPTFRERILEISEISNPVDQSKRMVIMDDLYLINWMRKNASLNSSDINDLVVEMKTKFIEGPYPWDFIGNLISESCVVDAFLYIMPKRYRGHQVHQFSVASLGIFLLRTYISETETLGQYVAKLMKCTPKDVEKCWLISAFLHDHAIPIVYMLQSAPVFLDLKTAYPTYSTSLDMMLLALKQAYHNLFSPDLSEIYERLLNGESENSLSELIEKELQGIGYPLKFEEYMMFDHGVMGAVNLTTRLRSKSYEYVDTSDMVKACARAVALHTSTEKMRLEEEPIGFLLTLCDEAQEWGREITLPRQIVIESPCIEIGPFSYNNGRRCFEDKLMIQFDFPENRVLKKTGWQYEKFKEAKEAAFSRLVFPTKHILPKRIDYHTSLGPLDR